MSPTGRFVVWNWEDKIAEYPVENVLAYEMTVLESGVLRVAHEGGIDFIRDWSLASYIAEDE